MNILFVAYPFPPSNAAGAVRTKAIAKYLARSGDSVTVLTVPSRRFGYADNWLPADFETLNVTRLEADLLIPQAEPSFQYSNSIVGRLRGGVTRKILRLLKRDPDVLWYQPACRVISRGKCKYDLVLATGGPWISFQIGHFASNYLKVPLVLDYRDLWNDSPFETSYTSKCPNVENQMLDSATGICVISKSMLEKLNPRIRGQKKLYVCENGFDPDEFKMIKTSQQRRFTIMYAGTLYPPKRTLGPLFESLKQLKECRTPELEWEFVYIGSWAKHVRDLANQYELTSMVRTFDYKPRADTLQDLAKADLVVVVTSIFQKGDAGDRSVVTSKIFDAIALGKRILLIAPDDSDAERFVASKRYGTRFHGGQIVAIREFIEHCMRTRDERPTYDNNDSNWRNKIAGYRKFLAESLNCNY